MPNNKLVTVDNLRTYNEDAQDKLDEALATKQDTLVSGTNIKTINNESLLGSGNIDISTTPMVEITWAALKALRDNSGLVPGMQYRITDYTCTTTTALTHSAEHVFDVIVIADDESTLNKQARAVLHEGDTYFANSNLAAWQLWYDLDNDQTKYAWADTVNGKGVIFRMIDEFNNDIPYDFKNIVYEDRPGFTYTQWNQNYVFARDSSLDADGYYGWRTDRAPGAWSNPYCFTTVETPATDMTMYKDTSGTVISLGGSIISISTESHDWYTFTVNNADGSLLKSNVIHDNVMKPWTSGLNRNIFKGDNCYSNTFDSNCYSNTFGEYCYSNTFSSNCYLNTFDGYCRLNAFGSFCYSNVFASSSYSNIFADSCHSISFRGSCRCNTFDDYCNYISLQSSASGGYLMNIHIHRGVKGAYGSPLVIDVPVKDQDYSIDYYAAGSQEIILGGNN